MKKRVLIMLACTGLLILTLCFSSVFLTVQLKQAQALMQPISLAVPAQWQRPVSALSEVRAEAESLRGNYQYVDRTLSGKLLSPRGAYLLTKAKLARGENVEAGQLIDRYRLIPSVSILKGLYFADLGYYPSARDYLAVAAENGQTSIDLQLEARLALCQLTIKQGDLASAAQELNKLDGSEARVQLVSGDLALASGDYPKASELYFGVMAKGYYLEDPNLLTKAGLAALGAGKDWSSTVAQLRQFAPQSGLADYLQAQAELKQENFPAAAESLRLALAGNLPPRMQPELTVLYTEIAARVAAEPAIQALIASGGH